MSVAAITSSCCEISLDVRVAVPSRMSAAVNVARPGLIGGIVVAAGAGNEELKRDLRQPVILEDDQVQPVRQVASAGFGSLIFRISFETGTFSS